MKKLKPMLIRLIFAPIILVLVIGGVICFVVIQFPYWVVNGDDFIMEKYFPICESIYDCLNNQII